MPNYLYRLARYAFRRRRLVLAAWLAAAIAAIAIAVASGGKTNDNFTIPGTEAQNAAQVLAASLPAFSGGQSTIVFAATGGSAKVTDPAARAAIQTAMSRLKSVPQVSAVVDPFQAGQVSPSGQVALGQVQWSAKAADVKDASLGDVKAAMKPVQAYGVQVAYNGSVYPGWRPPISETPELTGLIIASGILMITFGAFAAAGMPILSAIIAVITTLMGITAAASVTAIASASTTVALMLGLSCGIDYGLFILSRHRTNLLTATTPEESVPLAMGTAGSPVVFAAQTVIIALCGLTVAGIPFLTVMGLAAAGSVTIALLIALTLLPAMLGFADPKVAKFTRLPPLGARAERVARRSAADPDSPAGAGWARFVARHRVPVLLGGIALLGMLAIPATAIHPGLPSGASQPAGNTQRQAYDLTTEGFGAGYNGPLLIVAQDIHGAAATRQIAGALTTMPDVAQVTPLATQNGTSLIRLIPRSGPSDPATTRLVHTLRDDRAAIEAQHRRAHPDRRHDSVEHRRLGQAVCCPAGLPDRRGRPGVPPADIRVPDDPGAAHVDPGLPALDGRGARRAGRAVPVGLGPAPVRHHPGADDQLPAGHHAGDHLRPVQ
jgi:putative drug exporter of the RND superfamily